MLERQPTFCFSVRLKVWQLERRSSSKLRWLTCCQATTTVTSTTTIKYATRTLTAIRPDGKVSSSSRASHWININVTSATFYAACGIDNLVSRLNGRIIDSITYKVEVANSEFKQIGSAYDCCVACLTSKTCDFSFSSFENGVPYCTFIDYNVTCTPGRLLYEVDVIDPTNLRGFTVSNSNCGIGGVFVPQSFWFRHISRWDSSHRTLDSLHITNTITSTRSASRKINFRYVKIFAASELVTYWARFMSKVCQHNSYQDFDAVALVEHFVAFSKALFWMLQ